jgi:mono/diheme cytochrome c family protein
MRRYLVRLAPTILATALLLGCTPAAPAAPVAPPPTASLAAPSPTAAPAAPSPPTAAPTDVPTPLPPTPTAAVAVSAITAGTVPILPTIADTATTAPPPAAIPPSATVAPPAVAIVPTAPPAALSPNQIAATAIAGSIGEQCVASGPTPAKGFVGDPAIGKVLFAQRGCSACHGDQAQGLVGPKLAGTTLSFEAVLHQLRVPRGVMQRYLPSDQSDADECNVYIYVKGLKP